MRVRWKALLAVFFMNIFLLAVPGCQSSTPTAPGGWTQQATPNGLHFALPPGWKFQAASNGRVDLSGPAQEQGAIWPVFLSYPLDAGAAQAIARGLGKQVWPSAVWTNLSGTDHTVRMEGRDQQRTGMLVFCWVPAGSGTAATLHLANAPAARYGQDAPFFAQIFSSVTIQGSDAAGPQPKAMQYVRWRDPREGAFSLEVPQGWRVQGGLFRYAAVDTRPAVQVDSPDGQVMLAVGDATIPGFSEPTPMLNMAGLTEGRWYDLGQGVRLMVRRYETGSQFARDYAQNASKYCSGVQSDKVRERSDLSNPVNAMYQQFQASGMMVRLSVGEATVSCSKNAAAYRGYVFAGTESVRSQAVAMWYVHYLFAHIAPASRDPEAHAALQHMAETFQWDPQWSAQQSQTALNVSKINAQAQQKISAGIMSSYENRQRTMDEISRRRENAILGQVDVVNPDTGRQYKVDNSSNYYWIDGRGNIAGTQTATRPNMDFQQLMKLP